MRIMQVIIGLGVGGAERVVVSLADGLAERGHEVCIVSLMGGGLTLPSHRGVSVVHLGLSRNPLRVLSVMRNLVKEIRKFRPDVVHSHMKHAILITRFIRCGVGIPRLINTFHNKEVGGWRWKWAYRLTDCLADVVTNVSQEATESYEAAGAVPKDRMLAIHNGIDVNVNLFSESDRVAVRRTLGITPAGRLLVAVGRLYPQKDYYNLLSAALMLPPDLEWTIAIAGEGPLRQQLEAFVQERGLAARVRFLGVRNDIPGLMSAADVFVLSSAREGFGMVVAEAMACERVVVATDCGGVAEVVGNCGFLVPPRTSGALSEALLRALELEPADAAKLGRSARRRIVDLFSLDASVQRWIEIYSPS